jgi:hypothetical protein
LHGSTEAMLQVSAVDVERESVAFEEIERAPFSAMGETHGLILAVA